jgi:hypothetical protein
MPGPVERAVRAHVSEGQRRYTIPRRAAFSVASMDDEGIVLLFGWKQARTRLSWERLEGVVPFLHARGWVSISGTGYSTDVDPDTLDGYPKGCIKRATAGWVAAQLATADVVEIDDDRQLTVRLGHGVPMWK